MFLTLLIVPIKIFLNLWMESDRFVVIDQWLAVYVILS